MSKKRSNRTKQKKKHHRRTVDSSGSKPTAPSLDLSIDANIVDAEKISRHIYWGLLALLVVLAAVLRFWGMGDHPQLVFDEVYFSKYAHNYLTHTDFFDTHPPLSKYLIAGGIWLYNIMPFTPTLDLSGSEMNDLNTAAWRWLNAVTGTLLVILVSRLSLYLYPSRVLSLLLALFVAIDGSLLVESRFGLNNIYIVTFGMAALFFLAKGCHQASLAKWHFSLCGIFLAFTYSIKWNGLGYSAVVWGFCLLAYLPKVLNSYQEVAPGKLQTYPPAGLARINPLDLPVFLLILPLVVYFLLWVPHVNVYDQYGIIEMQKQVFGYHSNAVGGNDHPYCSSWYSWPLLMRPISYLFDSEIRGDTKYFTAVHLLGNPALYWVSFGASFLMAGFWFKNLIALTRTGSTNREFFYQSITLGGFVANWLPWMLVSRCLFLYHYMPAAVFSFMATAWLLMRLLLARSIRLNVIAYVLLLIIIAAFIYWLPIHIGIDISAEGYYDRMWFKSWI